MSDGFKLRLPTGYCGSHRQLAGSNIAGWKVIIDETRWDSCPSSNRGLNRNIYRQEAVVSMGSDSSQTPRVKTLESEVEEPCFRHEFPQLTG